MRQIPSLILYAVLAISVCPLPGFADTVSFSLIPADGNVSGPAGSTVGWGYSITNQSATNWLLTSALSADSFTFGTPTLVFDFPVLAPGSTALEAFDSVSDAGLYGLTWDLAAPNDYTNYGSFTLSTQWWGGDPFNGGSFISDAPDSVQTYSATVTENTTTTPEPSTLSLTLPLLALILLGSKKGFPQLRNTTGTGS
jgi:hypothetical protein